MNPVSYVNSVFEIRAKITCRHTQLEEMGFVFEFLMHSNQTTVREKTDKHTNGPPGIDGEDS